MRITNWPKQERPREKLLLEGAQSLSDADLLAIFIRTGVKGKTAVDLARELLVKFHDLRILLDTNVEDFCQLPGLGKTKYVALQAALEISRRYLRETLKREDIFNNSGNARMYLSSRLRNRRKEIFAAFFLDNQHRVICYEEMFQGSINRANIYPREIVKRALAHNAAAMILAHNHTSGVAQPSPSDKKITKELLYILQMVEVSLLDHIIVGDGEMFSFAEKELL